MNELKFFGDLDFLREFDEGATSVPQHVFVTAEGARDEKAEAALPRTNQATANVRLEDVPELQRAADRAVPPDGKYQSQDDQNDQDEDILLALPDGFVSPASIDVPLFLVNEVPGNNWHIGGFGNHGFGTRRDALFGMGLSGDRSDMGDDIGVVIIDGGLSQNYVNGLTGRASYGGGWWLVGSDLPRPGRVRSDYARTADVHGNMIARNVLSLAPAATIYDAPVLPERVSNLPAFTSVAAALFHSIAAVIAASASEPFFPRHKHWIIVNAWAAATTMAEPGGVVSYAGNPSHQLNAAVTALASRANVDVIFAAGNAGAFQPARLTGPYDRGHFKSIWGSNGLPLVHTIGAMRTDSLSIGASSQGPSRPSLTPGTPVNQKPNFVAPSWFSEDTDRSVFNTGTSAASAVFAGFLAGIASEAGPTSSAILAARLNAMPSLTGGWSAQRGRGPISL